MEDLWCTSADKQLSLGKNAWSSSLTLSVNHSRQSIPANIHCGVYSHVIAVCEEIELARSQTPDITPHDRP